MIEIKQTMVKELRVWGIIVFTQVLQLKEITIKLYRNL